MIKLSFYTSLALLGFAGNSVLCRLALGEQAIDAGSFTAIRLLSGIVMLLFILSIKTQQLPTASKAGGSWLSGFLLFAYALSFSYAYLSLDTGTGALVLFGAVASGLAYTIWYKVLADLSAVQAAVLQLLVPVIAAVGGVVFAGELPSFRLLVAALLVLGGLLLVVLGRRYLPGRTVIDRHSP